MPTDKPRVTITMTEEQLSKIDEYRFGNKIKNQTQAILSLIENGIQLLSLENEKAPATDESATGDKRLDEIVEIYKNLNEEGRTFLHTTSQMCSINHTYKKHDSFSSPA